MRPTTPRRPPRPDGTVGVGVQVGPLHPPPGPVGAGVHCKSAKARERNVPALRNQPLVRATSATSRYMHALASWRAVVEGCGGSSITLLGSYNSPYVNLDTDCLTRLRIPSAYDEKGRLGQGGEWCLLVILSLSYHLTDPARSAPWPPLASPRPRLASHSWALYLRWPTCLLSTCPRMR